ncbi:hypothetical protein G7046_g7422 [Stylonectria norvegica]|nr:hypothetical protein G7046_g7422 [Stylonectria norvegica]
MEAQKPNDIQCAGLSLKGVDPTLDSSGLPLLLLLLHSTSSTPKARFFDRPKVSTGQPITNTAPLDHIPPFFPRPPRPNIASQTIITYYSLLFAPVVALPSCCLVALALLCFALLCPTLLPSSSFQPLSHAVRLPTLVHLRRLLPEPVIDCPTIISPSSSLPVPFSLQNSVLRPPETRHHGRPNGAVQVGGSRRRWRGKDGPHHPVVLATLCRDACTPTPTKSFHESHPADHCLFSPQYDPTIEDSYRKQVVIDDQPCMLEVLDTAGQEEYTALRDQWIRDGEGFVLVYSISSRSSFSRIKRFHHQIQRVKESTASSPSYPGSPISTATAQAPVPIMLVGNKSDRVTEREVSTQEGHALARDLGCEFVEASAKNCINVEKAFYDVVRILRRQRQQAARPHGGSGGRTRTGNGDAGGRDRDPNRHRRKDEKGRSKCVVL